MLYSSHILEITECIKKNHNDDIDAYPLPDNIGDKSPVIILSGNYKNLPIKVNARSFEVTIELIDEKTFDENKHNSSDCGVFVADDEYYYAVQFLICSEKFEDKPIDFSCSKYDISPYLWSVIVGNLISDEY